MSRTGFAATLFFLAVLTIGVRMAERSWQGLVYLNLADPRSPAAIPGRINLSHLRGDALREAAHKQLLAEARLLRGDGEIGVELGHFAVSGPGNQAYPACQIFNKMELTFVAENISESGDQPTMLVDGVCGMDSANIERIAPIWIPYSRIIQDNPGDIQLSFFDDKPVTLTFDHLGTQWPQDWVLQSVRLYSTETESATMTIELNNRLEGDPKPLRMSW